MEKFAYNNNKNVSTGYIFWALLWILFLRFF